MSDAPLFNSEILERPVEDGLIEYELIVSSLDGEPFQGPIELAWRIPAVDVTLAWHSAMQRDRGLPVVVSAPKWKSNATMNAPLLSLISGSGQNRIAIAFADATHQIEMSCGSLESSAELLVRAWIQADRLASSLQLILSVDTRNLRYEEVLRNCARWWATMPGNQPLRAPDAGRWPVYSTWTSMHEHLESRRILTQCRMANDLGCEMVIVDDGWQQKEADNHEFNNDYRFTGDWEPERLHDLPELVEEVHLLGMKFMLWFAVPFAGMESKAFEKFGDMCLRIDNQAPYWRRAGVLDPRYPEVRQYLIETYERAVRDWGVDGLKLDFINEFRPNDDEIPDPRWDIADVFQAVDVLLKSAVERLRTMNPEILIEFRQPYISPLMRTYGNLFRAWDCPLDYNRNRYQTLDLRMLADDTAVHSDMFFWHPDEPVESAARQVLSTLFSVPQVSVLIDELPVAHQDMLRFWLGFWRRHREVLLNGQLQAEHPEHLYTMGRVVDEQEEIVACYSETAVSIEGDRPTWIVNATHQTTLAISTRSTLVGTVLDCMGGKVETMQLAVGTTSLPVPVSGLLELQPV